MTARHDVTVRTTGADITEAEPKGRATAQRAYPGWYLELTSSTVTKLRDETGWQFVLTYTASTHSPFEAP